MNDVRLRLGHSPDPDDAFMFYALAAGRIDPRPYRFEHVLEDIQTLNERAARGELEITAISIAAYPHVASRYALTACGASMGDGYGPMVVSRRPITSGQLRGLTIAVPGTLTSAFLALQLCVGRGVPAGSVSAPSDNAVIAGAFRYVVVPFDRILDVVQGGQADAGLIIHEGQLTYARQGLEVVVDLGAWWRRATGLPLPLGGNCVRRDLGATVMRDVTRLLRRSILYSLDHREEAVRHALRFGRGLDESLADRFVGMYVNHWTVDLGREGRNAVALLLGMGRRAGLVPAAAEPDIVDG